VKHPDDPKNQVNKLQLNNLKKLRVRGPLLVLLSQQDNDLQKYAASISYTSGTSHADNKIIRMQVPAWLAPAPADALLLKKEEPDKQDEKSETDKLPLIQRLVPVKLPDGAQTDFQLSAHWLVGQTEVQNQKASSEAPNYWHWSHFMQWLYEPEIIVRASLDASFIKRLGLPGPQRESRVHVRIDPEKVAGKEGMLFETRGLEFTAARKGTHRLNNARRLALAIEVEESGEKSLSEFKLQPGVDSIGSERRIVHWHKSGQDLPPCPQELERMIVEQEAFRLILLTPACFKTNYQIVEKLEDGYHPNWLLKDAQARGMKMILRSCAVQRPQPISGWDLENRRPKPTRLLAPAGSVYFLSFEGSDKQAVRAWIKETWMQCISDEEQDRRDGFGLAVLGTWSGKQETMKTKGVQNEAH
jgi:CRISPR-associated protein Cmr3